MYRERLTSKATIRGGFLVPSGETSLMIQQTVLHVIHWEYMPPKGTQTIANEKLNFKPFKGIPKKATTKKSIGIRWTYRIILNNETILSYIAEDSYVFDPTDVQTVEDLRKMVHNSYQKFTIEFDKRKAGTPLQFNTLKSMDESQIDLQSVWDLL